MYSITFERDSWTRPRTIEHAVRHEVAEDGTHHILRRTSEHGGFEWTTIGWEYRVVSIDAEEPAVDETDIVNVEEGPEA